MIKTETIYPLDVELCINGSQTIRRMEKIWLTANQYEVLSFGSSKFGIVATRFVNERIEVFEAEEFERPDFTYVHFTGKFPTL